jgi:alkylated DNA nucleotide flippase Atl1/isopentenyldiphosphate isomerase
MPDDYPKKGDSPPNFRDQVLQLVAKVPVGRLVTYGQVARVLGRPRASRVVGGFMSSLNSEELHVPWQRVLNREGKVSARADIFAREDPVDEQKNCLAEEGLEPDSQGRYCLQEHGMTDAELRALFDVEMLELVDLENNIVGIAPRPLIRGQNLLHRGVGILCWNSQGELYVHQRTAIKDVFPSCYDMMVGGALEAGEEYATAALREVQEEYGVGDVTPEFLLETLYDGPKNRSFIQLFQVTWDGPITWQEEEICWGRWMPFEEVLRWVDEVEIVPDGLQVFRTYLEHCPK